MITSILSHKTGLVTFEVSDGVPEETWAPEIPWAIAGMLMEMRAFHAANDERTMKHWCWDLYGTVYMWHADTNRYEICKNEADYLRSVKWYD